jgi:hypothetical protein
MPNTASVGTEDLLSLAAALGVGPARDVGLHGGGVLLGDLDAQPGVRGSRVSLALGHLRRLGEPGILLTSQG